MNGGHPRSVEYSQEKGENVEIFQRSWLTAGAACTMHDPRSVDYSQEKGENIEIFQRSLLAAGAEAANRDPSATLGYGGHSSIRDKFRTPCAACRWRIGWANGVRKLAPKAPAKSMGG